MEGLPRFSVKKSPLVVGNSGKCAILGTCPLVFHAAKGNQRTLEREPIFDGIHPYSLVAFWFQLVSLAIIGGLGSFSSIWSFLWSSRESLVSVEFGFQ